MNQLMSRPIASWPGTSDVLATPSVRALLPGSPSEDERFLHMLDAYRISGGLFRGSEVSTLLEGRGRHPAGTVDKWRNRNEVIHFEWQWQTWMPRLQFDMAAKRPWAAVGLVATELAGFFDNWEMTLWFARPSTVLGGRPPLGALRSDPDMVIQAARHDRQQGGEARYPRRAEHEPLREVVPVARRCGSRSISG